MRASLRGARTQAALWRNFLLKFNIPKNLWKAGFSAGGGKAEMVVECFCRGKHLEAGRRCPRNLILETANSNLGRPIVSLYFLLRLKTSWRLSTWEERPLLKMRISSM